jgi:hypothetical protein
MWEKEISWFSILSWVLRAHHIGLPELKLSEFWLFVARFRFPTKRPFSFYHHHVQAGSGLAMFTGYRRLYHQLCRGQDVNLTANFLLISRSKIPDVQLHIIHIFLRASALYYGGSGSEFDSEVRLFWPRVVIVFLSPTRLCRDLKNFVSRVFHRIT